MLGFCSNNLQKHIRKPAKENENLQTSNGLDKRKYTKQNTQVYLLFGAMGHHALAGRSTSLSLLAMEELWLNGRMNG